MTFKTKSILIVALVAIVSGFGGAAIWQYSGLGDNHMRQYLLDNPEILPEMVQKLESKQGQERLNDVGEAVTDPFPGAVLGNPSGTVTLVEFSDYACGFCRKSRADVDSLIAANPDLKVVIREWPIFEGSDTAAKMALAAANQGKFAAFHNAMFDAGAPSPGTIEQAATQAGLDMNAAKAFLAGDAAQFEFAKNAGLAQQLGFGGTPAWVVGSSVIEGAVGVEQLQKAIDTARSQ